MSRVKKIKKKYPSLPRTNKITIMFNDQEYKTICNYLSKYKITNRSRWVRETIMTSIFQHLSDDYPTLFSEKEMKG